MCRCTFWSCAGVVHGQLHMLYECIFSFLCTIFLFFLFFIFFPLLFFLLFYLQYTVLLRVFLVAMWTIVGSWSMISVLTVSVTMNSGGLQGGFYDVVWLLAFVLGFVT